MKDAEIQSLREGRNAKGGKSGRDSSKCWRSKRSSSDRTAFDVDEANLLKGFQVRLWIRVSATKSIRGLPDLLGPSLEDGRIMVSLLDGSILHCREHLASWTQPASPQLLLHHQEQLTPGFSTLRSSFKAFSKSSQK